MKLRKRGYVGTTSTVMSQREKDNAILAREAAAEGFVLLKNEAQTLPLKPGTKIGLYGAGAVRTIKGGTGSGDVNNRYNVNIYDGLKNAGYEITSVEWLEGYDRGYLAARESWKAEIFRKLTEECNGNFFEAYSTTPFSMPAGAAIDEAAAKVRISRLTLPPEIKKKELDIEKIISEKEESIKNQDFEKAANLRDNEKQLKEEFEKIKNEWRAHSCTEVQIVDEDDIAKVVSIWTKVPVEKLPKKNLLSYYI